MTLKNLQQVAMLITVRMIVFSISIPTTQFIYNKKNIQVTSNNNMLFNELYNTKLPTIKILNK